MRDKDEGLTLRGETWHINKVVRIGRLRERIRESTGCQDIRAARKVRDRRIAEVTAILLAGGPAEERRVRTWGEAAVEYVADLDRRGKDSTRCKQDIRMVIQTIGALPLDHVHQGTLQPWIDAQRGIRSSGTVDRALRTVSTILRYAAGVLRDGHTPWLTVSPPKLRAPDWGTRQPRPITWEEQDRLIEALPPHLVAPVLFAVATGARQAEVTTLRWDQARSVAGLLDLAVWWIPPEIRKANSRKAASDQDGRYLVANRMARAVIERQRGKDAEWVFPSPKGGHLFKVNNNGWRAACKAAGLAIRFHDLRHTFGQRAADAGIPLDYRRSLLGHEHQSITEHYSSPGLARLLDEAERITRPGGALEVVSGRMRSMA